MKKSPKVVLVAGAQGVIGRTGRRAFCERGRHHGLRRFAQVYRRVGKRDRDLR